MASNDGGLDFGLGNLLSLQEVKIENPTCRRYQGGGGASHGPADVCS
jgi:hypothetical protein